MEKCSKFFVSTPDIIKKHDFKKRINFSYTLVEKYIIT